MSLSKPRKMWAVYNESTMRKMGLVRERIYPVFSHSLGIIPLTV